MVQPITGIVIVVITIFEIVIILEVQIIPF